MAWFLGTAGMFHQLSQSNLGKSHDEGNVVFVSEDSSKIDAVLEADQVQPPGSLDVAQKISKVKRKGTSTRVLRLFVQVSFRLFHHFPRSFLRKSQLSRLVAAMSIHGTSTSSAVGKRLMAMVFGFPTPAAPERLRLGRVREPKSICILNSSASACPSRKRVSVGQKSNGMEFGKEELQAHC